MYQYEVIFVKYSEIFFSALRQRGHDNLRNSGAALFRPALPHWLPGIPPVLYRQDLRPRGHRSDRQGTLK